MQVECALVGRICSPAELKLVLFYCDIGIVLPQRLTDLEIKVAYQEQTIEELNQALVKQELALQKLERVSRELLKRVDSMDTNAESGRSPSASDEVPPHY